VTERFIGREVELHRWATTMRSVRLGRGRLISVAGEAGVGKTRLCEEGADRAREAGFTVVWGRCWTDQGAPALWPWQSMLAELGPDVALSTDAGHDGADPQRFSRFRQVADRLAEACAVSPTLLIIDDLHAADPAAVLLTRFIARDLHRLPLLMVITHRPGEVRADSAPLVADLERDAEPIALHCFDVIETRDFLAAHGMDHADPALTEALHRVTDGNPLVLRRLVALNAADPAGGLPGGLRSAIDQALGRLSAPVVRLLTVSAVLGRTVSVAEAGAMVGESPLAVHDSLHEAARAGLVRIVRSDSFTFGHDLVRAALAASLSGAERLDAHARAAEIIGGAPVSADRVARRAHHAVNAASRSAADARLAVDACRIAARSMVRNFSYEQAATQLSTAAGLYSADLGPVPADLLLEWAQALLSAGKLAEARPLFDRAARAAEDQPVVFAEAALGLGGIWVNEHRDRVERARVREMRRRALARLPEDQHALRHRLIVRQAAERVYDGGPIAEVVAAVADARSLGDDGVLAEALSMQHHAMLAPEHTRSRLEVADELISTASAAGRDVLALVGLCWRTVDLFHLGDPRAERSLADLSDRADRLSCQSVLFIVSAMEVMLLIRGGKLDEAEKHAATCFALGTAVGDADAFAYYSAHLLAIRWLQGRGAELVDLAEQTANSPTLIEGEYTFHATVARLAADAGQYDRARSALHRLAAGGLSAIPPSSTWLACMLAIVEAAAALGEAAIAREAYDLLLPYAGLPIMPSLAVVCFGSTHRALGLAAMTYGDFEVAVDHLEHAVIGNVRLANWPMTACTRADLAEALRRRDDPGDRRRAGDLLDSAINDATRLGMTARAAEWTAARQGLARSLGIRRYEGQWEVTFRDRRTLVDDLVGMQYLATLVSHPEESISALDLVSGIGDSANQSIVDDQARAAYARRARELAEELSSARDSANSGMVERIELEMEALTAEVERVTGLGGRGRNFAGAAERARTAVRKAIKRAIDTIGVTEPEVAEFLRGSVSTGYQCTYSPDEEAEPPSRGVVVRLVC
jgi:tetratricopeptide (TPR) repeat protein